MSPVNLPVLLHPHRAIDEKYLAWVREQPCWICAAPPPSEPDHQDSSGVGTKGPDKFALPSCRRCHDLRQGRSWSRLPLGITEAEAWRRVAEHVIRYYRWYYQEGESNDRRDL